MFTNRFKKNYIFNSIRNKFILFLSFFCFISLENIAKEKEQKISDEKDKKLLIRKNYSDKIKNFNLLTNTKEVYKRILEWESIDQLNTKIKWTKINSNDIEKKNKLDENIPGFKDFYEIEPSMIDFVNSLWINNGFATGNYLLRDEISHNLGWKSSFGGGEAKGTGNQNYNYYLNYGLRDDILISFFYSVSDDPLYNYVKNFNTVTPNYWEIYGASLKKSIYEKNNFNISTSFSIESWFIRSGDDLIKNNMFNSLNSQYKSKDLIGSFHIPITFKLSNKTSFYFLSGINFLPDKKNSYDQLASDFYGVIPFAGGAISKKLNKTIEINSSLILPLGSSKNSFNKNIDFYNSYIYSFGINYYLNPKISFEGKLTNSFGLTPSTAVLTIPSSDELGYYFGLNYNPWRFDSPITKFKDNEIYLNTFGITDENAYLPRYDSTIIKLNYDNKNSYLFNIKYSLSNDFQLDFLNLNMINHESELNKTNKKLLENYVGSDNLNTRVGGKFYVYKTKTLDYISALKVSLGRAQSSKQGYFFLKSINTFKLNNKTFLNLNPKFAWSGINSPKSIGASINYLFNKKYALVSETNIPLDELNENNFTLAFRYIVDQNKSYDLYTTNALGINDLGTMFKSRSNKFGVQFNYSF